jgi:hypothetical protein
MVNPLQVFPKIFLHFESDSIPEGVFMLGPLPGLHFLRDRPDTLLRIGTPFGASKIELGVGNRMAATALPPNFVLEEFNHAAAIRTFSIENVPRLPVPHILTRTFHLPSPFIKY